MILQETIEHSEAETLTQTKIGKKSKKFKLEKSVARVLAEKTDAVKLKKLVRKVKDMMSLIAKQSLLSTRCLRLISRDYSF